MSFHSATDMVLLANLAPTISAQRGHKAPPRHLLFATSGFHQPHKKIYLVFLCCCCAPGKRKCGEEDAGGTDLRSDRPASPPSLGGHPPSARPYSRSSAAHRSSCCHAESYVLANSCNHSILSVEALGVVSVWRVCARSKIAPNVRKLPRKLREI